MLFSRDWLARYVPLPEPPREVARRLTFAGLAVEGIESVDGDAILDVDVTTNRPDCMNHLGLARELAVLFERELQPPSFALPERLGGPEVEVEVEDEAACPRYVGRVVSGVAVGESPEWLKRRLSSIGLRAINNVVDVTNFVLWELGQPLHAYDLAKLAGGRIVVRRARAGERLTTLDGALRELDPEVLVIADAREPVGLAGVMGGAASEVTAATVDVLLEGAHFDRQAVRAAARRCGLHTDASHRFERGADPEICLAAVDRAAALIAELAGGTVAALAADRRARPLPPRRGRLDLARLDAFAGAAIPPAEVRRILHGLGFGLAALAPDGGGGPAWEVTVPSWRLYDFEPRPWVPGSSRDAAHGSDGMAEVYPQDLYEEVLRVHGYERIPAALPAIPGPDGHPCHAAARRRRIRRHLAACGYAEAIHYAFGDRAEALALPSIEPGAVPIELANPISERASVLRRSLVPGLVESARFNRRRGAAAVRLFEVATVFLGRPQESTDGPAELPDQPEMVALICGGTVGNPWQREIALDLFDAKGAIESLAGELGGRVEARPPADPRELPGLVAGSSAWLHAAGAAGGERPVGYLGRLEAEEGFPLYVAEVAADALEGEIDLAVRLPPRLPGIGADLTLTHALDVPWAEIERAIAALAPPDLVSWELVVRYRGEGVPDGAVNTTIHFVYNAGDRTLTQDEVNERQAALAAELARRFGWRGKE